MARVSVFQGGNVQRDDPRVVPIRAADFGPSAIGEGLQQLGKVAAEHVDVLNGIAALHDEAAVKEATNSVNGWYAEAGYTGKDPYFTKQGRAALDGRPLMDTGLNDLIKETRAGLQNPRQQKLFDDAVIPQQQSWQTQIAQHAAKETVTYNVGESNARAGVTGELARLTYMQNPQEGEEHIATGLSEVENALKLTGAGPDAIAEAKLKFSSGVYQDIGKNLTYSGPEGPELARAFVEKHKDSMTGDARESILTNARVYQNSLEAERRRQEADARRILREERQDRKDNAQSVYRNIQDGVVVDPKTLSKAMDDAKFAEDDALVEGLRQGGLKNNLTQQWAHASPSELQDRVNELSGEITRAKGKVAPDVVVERDHLQTLLNNSNSELGSDMISWGAKHLGVPIGRLNLDDPSSITARINASTQIARQTGRAPQPLTSEEAATLTVQLTSGTTAQKVALATKLAHFGPLATEAARQITNNVGFHNLIGLATHSNRGVASSRVNQILTGYDVLKGKPKLIDKDQSRVEFDGFMGQALQFFPDTKNGVYSNAQALLATEANEHGWSDWSQVDNRAWFRSVNSALGAYTNAKGEQVGGLHGFNGGITVLPEDISEVEFDQRIARSHGPEFRKAQNGDPVFSNGEMPTASDLRKMQWVPSGDGVYRLSDGHGFLHTKAGGFYEVDVRKLPSAFDAQLAAHGYTRR